MTVGVDPASPADAQGAGLTGPLGSVRCLTGRRNTGLSARGQVLDLSARSRIGKSGHRLLRGNNAVPFSTGSPPG